MRPSPDEEYGSAAATREGVIRGGAITSVAQVAKIALTLGAQVAVARLLLPEDFGLVAMVAPVLGFIQVVADLGVPQIIIQSPTLRYGDLDRLFWRNLAVSVGLMLAAMAAAPLMAWLYGQPRVLPLMLAMTALVPLSAAAAPFSALLARDMRYAVLGWVEIGALACNAAVTVGAALLGYGFWSIFFGQLAAAVVGLALFVATARWRPGMPRRGGIDSSHLSRAGNNVTAANVSGFLNVTLDNVLIGAVLGETALGLYDRAWKFAVQPLTMIIAPIGRVAVPTLSRLATDTERYRRAVRQFLEILLLICLPLMAFGLALGEPLVGFLLGPNWVILAPVFSVVCFGAMMTPINYMTFWLLISQGRTAEQMRWAVTTALINISSYAIGLYWGLIGVVLLSATTNWVIQAPLLMRAVSRSGPVDWRDMLAIAHPFVIAGLAETVALAGLHRVRPVEGFLGLALATIVAYAVFAAVVAAFPGGRAALANLWSVVGGRLLARRIA